MKKPVLFYTICDQNNKKYEVMLRNSFKKFHPDVDFYTVEGEELQTYLKDDPAFFYRATPILTERFLNDYDLVVKMDCDQIVCGDLSYLWKTTDYDVATVMNYNRVDPQTYGYVQGWGILPAEYMNCGLVSIRNAKFAHHWKVICYSEQFNRMQYKEQDLLNILVYYGNYNVRCLDHGDPIAGMTAWWGLISKGEWSKSEMRGDKIIVPTAKDKFPKVDTEIKVIHWAGGHDGNKMNYRIKFSEEVADRLDYLVGDTK